MQNFRPGNVGKVCLTLLSLTLLTQTVFGYDYEKISYLDSVSSSYTYDNQESDSVILNANSAEARSFEATFKLDSPPIIANSNLKVNLSLRDSDLRQALRMIADKAGLNIVFDSSVEGKITLDLNNISINDAFLVIFKSSQLTYLIDGNTITVMTLEASKDVKYTKQSMTVLPIRYVNAQTVADFLNKNLFNSDIFGLSSKPVVTSNPRTNQIVVFGSQADVNAIKRILPTLDTKPMVNTFKINHTTPKEMASFICASILHNGEGGDGGDTSSYSPSGSDDTVTLSSGYIACRNSVRSDSEGSDSLAAFKSSPLTIAYFPEHGKIATYGGTIEQVEMVKEFIKDHDKKQLMAYVELSVIELNETGSKTFSNAWELWTPFITMGFSPSSGLTVSPIVFWGDSEIKDIVQSPNKALLYQLNYLVENKNGRILTNPKIMVTNGKKSTIDLTSDYVKTVTSQILQNSDSVTSATQKTYDIGSDEGFLIEIVPFISPDGYVSMNLKPEFATIKDREYSIGQTGEQELGATLLQRRDLELKNIRVKDGETLILAGLIKESETQTVQKMPILSDLPIVGALFRGNANTKAREELVIVVTPHIIKDGDVTTDEQIYDL